MPGAAAAPDHRDMKKHVALAAIALCSLFGAKALAAAPVTQGSFGDARPGSLEVNLGGGALRQVACAPGAQPGTRCYLAR